MLFMWCDRTFSSKVSDFALITQSVSRRWQIKIYNTLSEVGSNPFEITYMIKNELLKKGLVSMLLSECSGLTLTWVHFWYSFSLLVSLNLPNVLLQPVWSVEKSAQGHLCQWCKYVSSCLEEKEEPLGFWPEKNPEKTNLSSSFYIKI